VCSGGASPQEFHAWFDSRPGVLDPHARRRYLGKVSSQDLPGFSSVPISNDRRRPYWSERQGRNPVPYLSGASIRRLFAAVVADFESRGMLQENFGYECVDAGQVPGRLGWRISDKLLLDLGRDDVWPITAETTADWDEDTFLDMIEFMFDHVSEGDEQSGRMHSFSNCGWHFQAFRSEPARMEYRERINELLSRLEPGYEISPDGEVLRTPPNGMGPLIEEASKNLEDRDANHVQGAIKKFLSRSSTDTQRRDAIRDLCDVLERKRDGVNTYMLGKDGTELFHIANKYWIRHNDRLQRDDYDHEAWWSWVFYLYLNSIYLISHLEEARSAVPPVA
jgi:hypothetical protein